MIFFKNFIMIIVLVCTVSAGEHSDKIYLKNGTIYTFSITCVNEWGLDFENSKSCSFNVMEKIETYNSNIVNEIKKIYPEIQILNSDSLYILNLKSLKIIKFEPTNNRLSKRFSFQMLSKFNSLSSLELRYSFEPTKISYFIYEFTYFLDFDDPNDSESFLPKFLDFSVGAGANVNISIFGASLILKYLPLGKRIDEYLYLSSNVRANIFDQMFFIVSYDYFFRDIQIKNEITRNTINFGLGINL